MMSCFKVFILSTIAGLIIAAASPRKFFLPALWWKFSTMTSMSLSRAAGSHQSKSVFEPISSSSGPGVKASYKAFL